MSAPVRQLRVAAVRPFDLPEAVANDKHVIVHCLNCQHARPMTPDAVFKKLGPVPFGMITGRLLCKSCAAKVAAIFPWYAPTPAAWAAQYRPALPEPELMRIAPVGGYCFNVQKWWGSRGSAIETCVETRQQQIAEDAFAWLVQRARRDEYFTLSYGAALMRDSRFKVVD